MEAGGSDMLEARIVKNFHGFKLDVEFKTDRGCMGILGAS